MTSWHVHATDLSDGVTKDLWLDGDRISLEPLSDAPTLSSQAFVLPGLVDVHCHPGTVQIGEPLQDEQLRADADALLAAGITLIRVPGSASRLPTWFGQGQDTPRLRHAGIPVAAEGGFFPGWGHQVPADQVPAVAAREAAEAGWCKLIVDWMTEDGDYAPTMSPEVIAAATRAVHDVGGRVAVHTQCAEGGLAAVAAGVDSIEHGMHLPIDALAQMAADAIVFVPTASTFLALAGAMTDPQVPPALRTWFATGLERHGDLTREAYQASVTVLAGTDLPPGHLNEEIRWLAEVGLPRDVALGAGSWTARSWLGLPGIAHDAPADLVLFTEDPRTDLGVLDRPAYVIIRGHVSAPTQRSDH